MQRFASKVKASEPARTAANRTIDRKHGLEKAPAVRTVLPERFAHIPVSAEREQPRPSAGAPLEPWVRARFETGLGRSLADVRIHTDTAAARAASALDADAYTLGRDVVFGPEQYRPDTAAGERLLAHELAHVAQQGSVSQTNGAPGISRPGDAGELAARRAADLLVKGQRADVAPEPMRIHRQEHGATQQGTSGVVPPVPGTAVVGSVGPGAEDVALIRRWMEQHQFAQPTEQPAEGERHVLLNGEDMTLTAAAQLGATALQKPVETVTGVMRAQLSPQRPNSAAGQAWVGPGNTVPGLPLMPRDFTDRIAIGKALELDEVDAWLARHNFSPPEVRDPTGDRVVVDGEDTTIERVADRVMATLGQYPYLHRPEVLTHLRQAYVAGRGGHTTQIVFGYTLVPDRAQISTASGAPMTQHQFTFQITRAHHANDSPGLESSFAGSVAFDNRGQIVSLQAQGQEAIVRPLLNGWVQISGLVQVMGGVNWDRPATGSATSSWALGAAAGGQILLTPNFRQGPLNFLTGHVQLGVQVLGQVQGTSSGVSVGGSAGLILNIPFTLGGGG